MDLSEFNDDDFDAKTWVDNILKQSESNENREEYVSSLISKLENYMQEVNTNIEKTSEEVLHALPKIMHDTCLLHNETLVLKDKMTTLKDDIVRVENDTGQSIKDIEHLDSLKSKLENAKEGLHEADNWVVLSNEVEDLLETGDAEVVTNKIVSMQQSLKVLASFTDFEEKKLHLEGLKNRLEAMVSPLLVKAFTSGNIDQSCIYVKIFKSIDRLPQLLKYYHKCQKGILLQKWRNLLEVDQDESSNWLHNYYDFLLSHWHAQMKWCNYVFASADIVLTLVEIYTDLLLNVDPSFNMCIDAALKQQTDKLKLLIQLKQITKQFAVNLNVAIESSNKANVCNNEVLLSLACAIYSPYPVYVKKYANFEETFLMQRLNMLDCIKEKLPDTIQALRMSVPQIFDLVQAANKRCRQFTEGCGYCGLIEALKTFFSAYVDLLRITLRQIDPSKIVNEDWNMFQICLSLLQHVGDVLNQLQEFENVLITSIQESSKTGDHPFNQYKVLFLDANGQREYESLLRSLQNNMTFMDSINSMLNKMCSDIHHTTYRVIFAPLAAQLEDVKNAPAWSTAFTNSLQSDLPSYSFTPQEYITQIGQYLMTLPQHLEPFLLQDNPSLRVALKAASSEYSTPLAEEEGGLAGVLLGIITRGTCQMYCDKILSIPELNGNANKQLATDIEYLGNVLDDLGLSLTEHLQQSIMLLRLNSSEYQTKCTDCNPRLVSAVRKMRNITST